MELGAIPEPCAFDRAIGWPFAAEASTIRMQLDRPQEGQRARGCVARCSDEKFLAGLSITMASSAWIRPRYGANGEGRCKS
jgi:hypothetical protein